MLRLLNILLYATYNRLLSINHKTNATAFLSTRCCRITLDATRKSPFAVGGQWKVGLSRVSSSVGSRAFFVAGPRACSQLSLRQMDCVETFKRHLKPKRFMDAYCVSD